jgi:hypothetical protein
VRAWARPEAQTNPSYRTAPQRLLGVGARSERAGVLACGGAGFKVGAESSPRLWLPALAHSHRWRTGGNGHAEPSHVLGGSEGDVEAGWGACGAILVPSSFPRHSACTSSRSSVCSLLQDFIQGCSFLSFTCHKSCPASWLQPTPVTIFKVPHGRVRGHCLPGAPLRVPEKCDTPGAPGLAAALTTAQVAVLSPHPGQEHGPQRTLPGPRGLTDRVQMASVLLQKGRGQRFPSTPPHLIAVEDASPSTLAKH